MNLIKSFWVLILFGVLQISANAGDSIYLRNKNMELVFSNTQTYRMLGMKIGSKELLPSGGVDTHPWEITYRGPVGENPALRPRNGFYRGVEKKIIDDKTASLIFTWDMALLSTDKTHAVRMFVTLNDDSELAEWDLEVDVPEGWIVSFLDFPRVTVSRPPDAKGIVPSGWGAEYVLQPTTEISARYPSGTGNMQLVLMHNDSECFYYATKDYGASDKRFRIDCSDASATFHTEITTSEDWTPKGGGTFRPPWTTVTGYGFDGWESAVTRWYRPFTYTTEWGGKTLASRNLPEWIYNADVWIRPMGVSEEIMEAVRKSIDIYGKGVGIHWYNWHIHPFDSKYPEYFPAKDGFVEMVKETKNLGAFVTPYINGRLWDPATDSYRELNGKDASCRKADGTLYTEIYSSRVINTVTCPASSVWQEIQKELIRRIQDELGTSGVYVDQIAAAPSEPCWAENHGHPKGGGEFWVRAYRELYDEIRRNYLKYGNILTSEENAECYIDLFDMLLIVNSPIRTSKLVPLFPIVYSDRVITSAFGYTPQVLTTGAFRFLNMMSLLWGAQLGWVEPIPLTKENAKIEAMFLKEMMLFRKANHEFFIGGQFMNEIIPTGDNPERFFPNFATSNVVRGARWRNEKTNREVIFLVNVDDEKRTVYLPDGQQITIEAMTCLKLMK